MKEITVIVPNEVGALAGIAEELGNQGINIISISALGFEDKGVIRIITSDETTAMRVLENYVGPREGYKVSIGDALVVSVPDRPGELAKIVKKIARAGINIESVYQLKRLDKTVELIIKPEKLEETSKVLKAENVKFRV